MRHGADSMAANGYRATTAERRVRGARITADGEKQPYDLYPQLLLFRVRRPKWYAHQSRFRRRIRRVNQKGPEVDEFVFPVRVYYEDTDSGGVVYHANYLKFMERARTEWLRSLGFGQERLRRELGILFTVRRMLVDFRKPAVFDDELIVVTRTAAPRHASLMFEQHVYRFINDALGSEPLCNAEVKVACVSATTLRPRGLPEQITAELRNVS